MDPRTDTHSPPIGVGSPTGQVTALYQAYATGLVRLAMLMLADQQAAEDVVQDAFLGRYRRWGTLADPGKALIYVRSSVLNGCRTVLRKRSRSGTPRARARHRPPRRRRPCLLAPSPATTLPSSPAPATTVTWTTRTKSTRWWWGGARTGKVSAGKFTRLQVTMRNESHGVMASTPGLIAF
jgi:DNA-directed RNA polymerase specialized sigma24 family protein